MTFLQITQLINNKIRNAILPITKIEHADVEQAIVNEIYANEFIETPITGVVFDKLQAAADGLYYEIKIKKVGKTVFLNGYLKNTSNQIKNNYHLNIINNDFKPIDETVNDISAKTFANQTVLGYVFGLNYILLGSPHRLEVFKVNGTPFFEDEIVRVFGFYTTEN